MFIQPLILLLSTATSTVSASESMPWRTFTDMKCQKEFQKMAAEKFWDKEMFREQVSSYNETVYRNLSHTIGEWVEVHLKPKASAEVMLIKDTTLTRVTFNSSCDAQVKNENLPWDLDKIFNKKTAEDWTNDDLRNLVSSGKRGMIYYWSPKFTYSVYDLPRVEKLARKFGYEFTSVVDPRASKEEVEGALEVMKKYNHSKIRGVASNKSFNRNLAMDIHMRGGFNHFPVVYVYNNKMIHPRWITGVMKDNGLRTMANEMAGELK